MRLFSEAGFHATPTSRIAKLSGVATGTLFHHFASKEALINELYIYVKRRLREVLRHELDATLDFRAQLLRLWCTDVRWFLAHYDEFIFVRQYCDLHLIDARTKELLYQDFEPFIELFRSAIAAGAMKSDHLEFVLSHYVANVQHCTFYMYQFPEALSDEALARFFDIYFSGIAAHHTKENHR
ncbi:MAG: TetR/AcrR family transcriptional regulator [Campylobacterales bacterium]|nr:TetR/AcrR family transcriptional regulator [Campylobacterales bacterium]